VQSNFDFAPGLTAQFKTLRSVLATSVYSSRANLDGCAAACDLSPSLLCRMLSRGQADERALDVDHIEKIVATTGDMRPVYWLIEKFLHDPERVKANAIQQLAQLAPVIAELVAQSGGASVPAKPKRR
jgi:hypothetical protein